MALFFSAVLSAAIHGKPEVFLFGGLFLFLVLGAVSQRNGMYLRTQAQGMTFREPWQIRAFLAALLGWLLLMCREMALGFHPVTVSWLLLCVAVAGGIFYMTGPNEIAFNTTQHSYRAINHWSWPTQVRSGSCDDLDGIFVTSVSAKGTFYIIGIAWKSGLQLPLRLGRFSKREQAEDRASQLSQKLGLARVQPPPKRAASSTKQST